jgi:hypothetical protein
MELAVVIERFVTAVNSAEVVRPQQWRPRPPDELSTGSTFPTDLLLRLG